MDESNVKRVSKIRRSKDELYNTNPSIDIIGYCLYESKETIRTTKVRLGKVNGKVAKISTDERSYVYKDISKFVKFYTDSGALHAYSELSTTAQRVMCYIIDRLEFNQDYIYLVNSDISKDILLNESSVSMAKMELLDKGWVYKGDTKYKYWINLAYVCVGHRDEIYKKHKDTTR